MAVKNEEKNSESSHTKFCIACDYPVAVYGRVWPCLHVFCLACASDLRSCALCNGDIYRVERVASEEGLFVSPTTLQGFKTQEELIQHAQQLISNMAQLR